MTVAHDAHAVLAAYWAAAEARDWAKFGGLVAEDLVYEAPQTGERVRGRDAYVRLNAEGFPGQWHHTVERIIGEGRHAASWVQMAEPGGSYSGQYFLDLDEYCQIARITGFWPTPAELPASRAHN
jgi:SnoaL-like domain